MDFFYPNLQNDFWRIFGLVFFADREHFLTPRPSDGKKVFDRDQIVEFLLEKKIAMYDTAVEVVRERGNASDAHLTVVTPLDLRRVLTDDLPECRTLITTGEKATETLLQILGDPQLAKPPIGSSVEFFFAGREMRLYRLPSSSRAYPLKIEKKAEVYGTAMKEIFAE